MLYPLSISSIPLHNLRADNLKILFDNKIYIKMIDYDIFNKYAIHKFNQYAIVNVKVIISAIVFNLTLRSLKEIILANFITLFGNLWKTIDINIDTGLIITLAIAKLIPTLC